MDHRWLGRLISILCGTALCEGAVYAQVSRPVVVTVTVVAAQTVLLGLESATNRLSSDRGLTVSDRGITLTGTSDIAVGLYTGSRARWMKVKKQELKELTHEELRGVGRVEVVYLGS